MAKSEFSPETWEALSKAPIDEYELLEDRILMYQFLMLQKGIDKDPYEWLKIQLSQADVVNKGIIGIINKQRPQISKALKKSLDGAVDVATDKLEEVNPDEKPVVIVNDKAVAERKDLVDNSLKIMALNHSKVTTALPAKIYSNLSSMEGHTTWTMEQHLKEFHKAIERAYQKELPNMTSVNYSDKRNVSFKSYMEMAIRTEVNNVAVDMMNESGKGLGIVFYICSTLSDSAPDHAPYQSKVYVLKNWMSVVPKDKIEEYQKFIKDNDIKTLEWAKNEGTWTSKTGKTYKIALCTRPNCRHTFTPITYEQAKNPGKTTKELGIHDTGGKYDPSHYKWLQRQRAAERRIRDLKLKYNNKLAEIKTTPNEADAMMLNKEADVLKKQIRDAQKKLRDMINGWDEVKPDGKIIHHPAHDYLDRQYDRENPLRMSSDLGVK